MRKFLSAISTYAYVALVLLGLVIIAIPFAFVAIANIFRGGRFFKC